MDKANPTVKELIEGAARPYRDLWRDDELKQAALARHFAKKGHPVSSASFSRIFNSKQRLGDDVLKAIHGAMNIPMHLLRGEPMSREMENTLMKFKWSTILLAERLEDLEKDDYYVICQQIERAEETRRKLREAQEAGGVVSLEKHRRK